MCGKYIVTQAIPFWRRFQRLHPKRAPVTRDFRVAGQKASQIGVEFRDSTPIGVGLRAQRLRGSPLLAPLCSFVSFVVRVLFRCFLKYKTQRFAVAFVSAILLHIGCYSIFRS